MNKLQNATKKTLDTQHVTKLQSFQQNETVIADLKSEIEKMSEDAAKMKTEKLTDEQFDNYMSLCDKIAESKKELEKLEKQGDEVDYYINTAPILFQYYDILENGKDVNTIPKAVASEKSILKYFVKPEEPTEKSTFNIDRASLLEKYMHVTDPNYIRTVECESKDKCPHCESNDRNILLNDGLIYCNFCSTVEYIIVDHERPSYKDPPKEISYFAYKRKLIDALKSHVPRLSEFMSWKNTCGLRVVLTIIAVASSFL